MQCYSFFLRFRGSKRCARWHSALQRCIFTALILEATPCFRHALELLLAPINDIERLGKAIHITFCQQSAGAARHVAPQRPQAAKAAMQRVLSTGQQEPRRTVARPTTLHTFESVSLRCGRAVMPVTTKNFSAKPQRWLLGQRRQGAWADSNSCRQLQRRRRLHCC